MKKKIPANLPARADSDQLTSCSAQDCTGLIPAGPLDEQELENYEELYPFLPKPARPDKNAPKS